MCFRDNIFLQQGHMFIAIFPIAVSAISHNLAFKIAPNVCSWTTISHNLAFKIAVNVFDVGYYVFGALALLFKCGVAQFGFLNRTSINTCSCLACTISLSFDTVI